MSVFFDLIGNYWLISAVCAWFVAQLLKTLTGMFRERDFSLVTLMFSTGGMPSSHTASVVALTTAAGLTYGLGSFAFAASFMFAMVVMIDATGVRRETGEQAKILNRMMKQLFEAKDSEEWNRTLKELVGHTPMQVFAGAGVGIVVPLLIRFTPWF
ncbi:MAG: divergent PAP2 family protein [Clostridia bacterium]|nr:divergent PAP2 family protein [Clostridia bacterium]